MTFTCRLTRASILLVLVALGCSKEPSYVPKHGPFGLFMGMKPNDPWFQSDSTKLEEFDGFSGTLLHPPIPAEAFSAYHLSFASNGLCGIMARNAKYSPSEFRSVAVMLRAKYGEPSSQFPRLAANDSITSFTWDEEPMPSDLVRVSLQQVSGDHGSLILFYDFKNSDLCVSEWKAEVQRREKNPF